MLEFPQKLDDKYLLAEQTSDYAIYRTPIKLGFYDEIRVGRGTLKNGVEIGYVETIAGNTWGTQGGCRMLLRTDLFLSPQDALDNLLGVVHPARPPKRKPRVPEPLTVQEIEKLAAGEKRV